MHLNRRTFLLASASLFAIPALAAEWQTTLEAAKGQTVYFNAWAGSDTINAYIAWVGEQVKARYGVTLEHVKITDTAEVVRRVRDEVKAGKADGSVDLVWINGENFRAMKSGNLLFGPFASDLPNFKFVDIEGKPTTLSDFAEPTDGLESPWGMAQLTFFADGAKVKSPPLGLSELISFAEANPGRVTYPAPPDFHGTTFVKQVFIEAVSDKSMFAQPIGKDAFMAKAKLLTDVLDLMHPHLWRDGKQFPQSQSQVKQMVADGELLIGLTFNPNEPANLVATGEMPASTIAWQHKGGTIGNTHFVAIPINSKSSAAAQVVADFLLSPEAQARKADLKQWGDPTVLAMAKLSPDEAQLFGGGETPGAVSFPGPAIPEPHGSWVPLIEALWLERYGG
ncbi:MAG: ABC transporter substrate-binding protein [Rhizobiales bacterium]|nr:ABC transporter substrate-binding protein [Hyphomicrobiales bacterium]